jgi:hypothetical protein
MPSDQCCREHSLLGGRIWIKLDERTGADQHAEGSRFAVG